MAIIQSVVAKFEKVSAANPFFFNLYAAPYSGVINREIELGNINKDDVVLNIGCGAMPFTAIYIAKKTGARVIAVDKDENVIEKAIATISLFGLEKQVSVINGDGKNMRNFNHTKVLVALQTCPKEEVLKNLLKISQPGTKLLFRHPRKFLEKQYTAIRAKCDGYVKHNMITFNRTILFEKR